MGTSVPESESLGDPRNLRSVLRLIDEAQGSDTLSRSLRALAELAARLADGPSAGVFLVDRVTGDLRLVASWGLADADLDHTWSVPASLVPAALGGRAVGLPVEGLAECLPRPFRSDACWLPLSAGRDTDGSIIVAQGESGFDGDRLDCMDLVASYAGRILGSYRLNRMMRSRVDDVTALLEVEEAVSGSLDLGEVLHLVLAGVRRLCGAGTCSVMLLDDDGQRLRVRSSIGLPEEVEHVASRRLGEGISGRVAATGRTLFVRDEDELVAAKAIDGEDGEHHSKAPGRYKSPSLVCIPLRSGGNVVGVLNVNDKTEGEFTVGDVELLQLFANHAAIAVGNAIAHREMRRQAITDGLTRTYLPGYFRKRLSEIVAASRAHGSPLAVVMVDLDRFKSVNDTYGHPVGDQVLEGVAAALRATLRPRDIVARYGGEEFVQVLVGVTPASALAIVNRQRKAIESARFGDPGKEVGVTASFGLAMMPLDADAATELVRIADQNLYAGKRAGGNTVCCSGNVTNAANDEDGKAAQG